MVEKGTHFVLGPSLGGGTTLPAGRLGPFGERLFPPPYARERIHARSLLRRRTRATPIPSVRPHTRQRLNFRLDTRIPKLMLLRQCRAVNDSRRSTVKGD